MERNSISSSSRHQRNKKERDRRIHMRDLISNLASALHPQPSKMTVPHLLGEAASHVKQMHARIEELKLRKAQAEGYYQNPSMVDQLATSNSTMLRPVVDIKSGDDSTVEVNLISGLTTNFMLHDVIRVIQEEGAEVISFSCYKAGGRIIYTIKSKALCPRIGIETLRIHERLHAMLYNNFDRPAS